MAIGEICKINGCTRVLKKTEGRICQMHRSRYFRHGDYDISPNWPNLKKGQPHLTKTGYIRVSVDGKRVLQHRYIMEQHLGRKLTRSETIHHINGIRADNRIENLELIKNNSVHLKAYHNDFWEKRKVNKKYTAEEIENVLSRIDLSPHTYDTCFCGGKYYVRNLCSRHYHWAYVHKFCE